MTLSHQEHLAYERFKSDTISIVSYTGRHPYVYTRSIEVANQCLTNGNLVKSLDTTNGLRYALLLSGPYSSNVFQWDSEWGPNLVASEHDVYKRHRRVVGPAFGSTM